MLPGHWSKGKLSPEKNHLPSAILKSIVCLWSHKFLLYWNFWTSYGYNWTFSVAVPSGWDCIAQGLSRGRTYKKVELFLRKLWIALLPHMDFWCHCWSSKIIWIQNHTKNLLLSKCQSVCRYCKQLACKYKPPPTVNIYNESERSVVVASWAQ